MHRISMTLATTTLAGMLAACGGSSGSTTADNDTTATNSATSNNVATTTTSTDIKDAIFVERSGDCADYADDYSASVLDIQRALGFDAVMTLSNDGTSCAVMSNNIPNHDFNDGTASFATQVSTVAQGFSVPRNPTMGTSPTSLTQAYYNGVMLNGVPIDLLSAGCYDPSSPRADADGNTPIGCPDAAAWLLEPLGTGSGFGVDMHNAHVQPDGSYHYHGSPNAMFDDFPGPEGSPVIGFAADGFPIYGSYFYDDSTGQVRKAISGHTLKAGPRPSGTDDPGGLYDGTYVADWEYTDAGDLDDCNGMEIDRQYGYYVTDGYPWIIGCLMGLPDLSFRKF